MSFIFVPQPRIHLSCFGQNHALLKETTRCLYNCNSHYDFKFMMTHAFLDSFLGDPGFLEQKFSSHQSRDRRDGNSQFTRQGHLQGRQLPDDLLQGVWISFEVGRRIPSCPGSVSKLYFPSLKLNISFLESS